MSIWTCADERLGFEWKSHPSEQLIKVRMGAGRKAESRDSTSVVRVGVCFYFTSLTIVAVGASVCHGTAALRGLSCHGSGVELRPPGFIGGALFLLSISSTLGVNLFCPFQSMMVSS